MSEPHPAVILSVKEQIIISANALFFLQGGAAEPKSLASLGSLLDDQHWHHVIMERRSSHLNLTVDKHTKKVQLPADFTHWDIDQVWWQNIKLIEGNYCLRTCNTVMVCANTAEPWSYTEPQAETNHCQTELLWLCGECAVQWSELDRPGETERPPSYCEGKFTQHYYITCDTDGCCSYLMSCPW